TLAAAQRGADRLLGMVWIVERRAEYGNDGVADIFVDEAAVLLDDIGHCRKIFVHEFHELGWREHLGYRRKTRDVGEVDGDLAIFAAESRRLVRSDHLFDDRRRKIQTKTFSQEAPVLVGDQKPETGGGTDAEDAGQQWLDQWQRHWRIGESQHGGGDPQSSRCRAGDKPDEERQSEHSRRC